MIDTDEFVEEFLEHRARDRAAVSEYNRQYYLRTRKLKGRAGVAKDSRAKAYETKVIGNAQKKLDSDLKSNPKVKMNTKRRISEAEQKLIRAKSLAMRVEDPVVRADMLAQIAETQKKLMAEKNKVSSSTPKHTKPDLAGRPPGHPNYGDDPPAKKSTSNTPKAKRVEEDEVPMKSPTGAKLVDFSGKDSGKATYSDGSWFDGNGWHGVTKKSTKRAPRSVGNRSRK